MKIVADGINLRLALNHKPANAGIGDSESPERVNIAETKQLSMNPQVYRLAPKIIEVPDEQIHTCKDAQSSDHPARFLVELIQKSMKENNQTNRKDGNDANENETASPHCLLPA